MTLFKEGYSGPMSRLSGRSRAVDQLVEAEVLKQISTGKRDRAWIVREVITVLDEFATRSGRRG